MKLILRCLLLATVISVFTACDTSNQGDGSPVVAQANEHVLTRAELMHQMPTLSSQEDSVMFAENYVNTWVKNKLLFDKAILNLSDEQKQIEYKVDEFRQSLYIHKYEQLLINHNLDRKIDSIKIKEFYKDHKAEFLLNNDIVKSNYIKVDKNVGNGDKVKTWITSRKPEDLDKLKDFGFQFAAKFSFSEEWLDADFVFGEFPKEIRNRSGVMRYKILTTATDSLFNYYLLITDYKEKNDTAPLQYVSKSIKEILLQQRKRALITDSRNSLYDDASGKNMVKINLDQ